MLTGNSLSKAKIGRFNTTSILFPVIGPHQSLVVVSALDGILASWKHLQTVSDNSDYRVSLESLGISEAGEIMNIEAPYKQYQYMFTWEEEGDFAVCLRAAKELPKTYSGRTCSDIIHVNSTRGKFWSVNAYVFWELLYSKHKATIFFLFI